MTPAPARVDGLALAAVSLVRGIYSGRRPVYVLSVHSRPDGTPARASEHSLTRRNRPSALRQGPGIPRAFYFEEARDRHIPGTFGPGGAHRAHTAGTPARHRAAAGDRNLRQAGIAEPGRIGQGPGGPGDDPGRRTDRAPAAGQNPHRRDLRQHRHLVRHARRRPRLPGHALRALQRHARSASGCCMPMARSSSSPIPWKAATAPFARSAAVTNSTRTATSTPTSTATRRTGGRTTTRPRSRSSNRPADG